MSERIEPLAGERQSNESNKAVQACNDYLRMGPGRSLRNLVRMYNESGTELPPTRHFTTIGNWSKDFGWQARAEAYDAAIEEEKSEEAKRRRKLAFETGLALDYERVITLKEMTALLLGELYERGESGVLHNLWLPDVKQIGSGEHAERVDIERFNAPLISEIRGLLDDLAKEVGDRRQKQVHSGQVDIVGMSLDEWRKEQQRRREEVANTLEMFDDE